MVASTYHQRDRVTMILSPGRQAPSDTLLLLHTLGKSVIYSHLGELYVHVK